MSALVTPETHADAPSSAPQPAPVPVTVAPAAPEAPATDVTPVVAEARAHLEAALTAELRHIEEAFRRQLAAVEARLAQSQAQVEALRKANAEAERKIAVLNEVKRSLASL